MPPALDQPLSHTDAAQASASEELDALRALADAAREHAGLPSGQYLESPSKLAMSNGPLGLTLSYGGSDTGLLSLWDVESGQLVLQAMPSLVRLGGGPSPAPVYAPLGYRFTHVSDPDLGPGLRVEVELFSTSGYTMTQVLTLFAGGPRWTYQLRISGLQRVDITGLRYFDGQWNEQVLAGEWSTSLEDQEQLPGLFRPVGVLPPNTVALGEPLLLFRKDLPMTLVVAFLDETEVPAYFSLARASDTTWTSFTLEHYLVEEPVAPSGTLASKRLLVEFVPGLDPFRATQGYRETMARLYPPAPLPDWLRYQWLSWYVNYMDVTEADIRRHIDYIAQHLSDLGPWHILLDAGWYIAEGRPEADWRAVDRAKFPSGLRALVDYAHSRGVRVVLYFSLPYVDDSPQKGNWNGLRGLLDQGPAWLIPLPEQDGVRRAVYDLEHPGFQDYLRTVMEDFFLRYDVDGIKVDGLGNASRPVLAYRLIANNATSLKDAVYIEGGWQNPIYAQPYAHSFRYGDEVPLFDAPYPNGGLKQHIDYGIYQTFVLGQRANIGAIAGDPNHDPLGLRWIEAALALGSQVALSFDLPRLSPDKLSEYRARLFHYRPFAGERRISGPPSAPTAFSYEVDGTIYLGVINREKGPTRIAVPLAEHGIASGTTVTLYDVTARTYLLRANTLDVSLRGQEFRLYIVRRNAGPIWTNSAVRIEESGADRLVLSVQGPAVVRGFLDVLVPVPLEVKLDGQPLAGEDQDGPSTMSYEAGPGILRLRYPHDKPHRIELRW